ncbi:HD domain-containing protein [Pengzhenrongella frigida]|uniref:Metal-dependent phosphohydrolase n=1 Tax=Pengzhenrongella frigida TaxID=1259133 RepID=A0A4Q5N3P9_9MICO|nr:hypothetical protein [Cellulomonas sp. HLT2-17]RYV51257.1 hypothetical protein EUA98_09575 [Cellulomonas sp. HLT2-17]
MGVYDAPQWLLSAWVRSCLGTGATASPEEIREVGTRLIERWAEPGRHFHTIKHLADVLARVDELAEETHEPEVVRLAAWYHGAIFDAANEASYANRGGEDEVASADLALEELTALGVPEKRAVRVHDLVIALRRHAPTSGDFDCAVLCDADLAVLASEPQRYKTYLRDIREEYSHLPVEDYVRARIRILTKLLQRRALFVSPLGSAWEEPARQNVGAELHRLEKELTTLEAAAAEPSDAPPAAASTAFDATASDATASEADPSHQPSPGRG